MARLIDADQFGVVSLQGKSDEFIEGAMFILDKIDEAQTVEERPHGEWIDRSDGGRVKNPFWTAYACSKCGWKAEITNYCPNCGSDMRPKEDDEE